MQGLYDIRNPFKQHCNVSWTKKEDVGQHMWGHLNWVLPIGNDLLGRQSMKTH